MPQVPVYERSVETRPALRSELSQRASPEDFGAAVGRGIESVGQGVGQFADAQRQVQELDDIATAKGKEVELANWDREARLGENGFLTLSGKAAIDGRKAYEQALVDKRRELAQGLSHGAQQKLALVTEDRLQSSLDQAAAHVAQERKAWIVESSNARLQMLADDALGTWADPKKVADNIEMGLDELRQQGKLLGWDAPTLQQKEEAYRSAAWSNVLLRKAQDDPIAAAADFLDHPERMTAEDGYALWNGLLPKVKEAAAEEATLAPDGSVTFTPRMAALVDAMPDDGKREIIDGVHDELRRRQTAASVQAKAAYDQHKGAVELGILTGDVTSEQTILSDPMIDDNDKATLLRTYRTEQSGTGAARTFLNQLGVGTAPTLNPYDADDKALSEKAFAIVMDAVPVEQKAAATAQFITETGMIPKPVIADVRLGLNSKDPKAVADALQQAVALNDTAPQALDGVENGKEIQEAAATYKELVGNQGLSVEQAAQRVVDLRDPENKAKADVLDTAWKEAIKDTGGHTPAFKVSDVRSAFDTTFWLGEPSAGLTPAAEAALQADYLAAAERAFKGPANGDANIARQMALAEMKRTYGVSRVSGAEVVTKYPPENFYPPIAGSQDYIRDLALKDAKSLAPDASNVMLVPSPQTSQDIRAGRVPRYNLLYQGPDGVWDMAPSLFEVSPGEIGELSMLASEERQVMFEAERARDEVMAAKDKVMGPSPVNYLASQIIDLMDLQPTAGDAERKAQLADIAKRRAALLGH